MSSLTAPRNTSRYGDHPVPSLLVLPVKGGCLIYAGALVALTQSGLAIPGTGNSSAAVAGGVAVGRAEKTADNSAGADSALTVEVRQGVHKWANSSTTDAITAADVGKPCYVVDDQTVARTSGSGARIVAGTVVMVDSDGVFVESRMPGPQPTGFDIELIAAADLSAVGKVAIKVDSAGKAAVAGAGEAAIGILQNGPASGAIAKVRVSGLSYGLAGSGGIAKGALVESASDGTLVTSTTAKVNTNDAGSTTDPVIGANVVGVCLVNASAAAEALILVQPRGVIPGTAA
jgi:hypothetical protein